MRFLRRFWRSFSRSSPAPDAGSLCYVHPAGGVGRFVFEKRKLTKEGMPKPHVFEQERHPEQGHRETSVCGMNGVAITRVWQLGTIIRHPMQAIAAVEVPVSGVTRIGLQCLPAPMTEYDEHGAIIGWADDKAKRVSDQQELVAAHTAVHRPPSLAPAASVDTGVED